jgi:hypothetical protein
MLTSTKTYTLNLLIKEVSNITGKNAKTFAGVKSALSPIAGWNSAKLAVLDTWLNGKLDRVLLGTAGINGATPRTRLLRALRKRKANGEF